ncbi:hypothetical protein [Geoglobus sp.]
MDLEKLRRLLAHWIAHNEEHISKYREWADRLAEEREDVSKIILESVEHFERGNDTLRRALERL